MRIGPFELSLKRKAAGVVPVRSLSSGLFGVIREPFTGAWQRNVQCDERDSILAFSAVYACVSRISSDIAKLPLQLMTQSGSIWVKTDPNSPFWGPLRKPNRYQNRIQFLACWVISKLIFGNAYVFKRRDGRGMVSEMYVLDPRRITALVTADGDVYYQIGQDALSQVPGNGGLTVPASEVIHDLMNPLFHPLMGVGPLYAAAASATQGTRIQANSATFFQNMSRPSGFLSGPGVIDDVTAERLQKTVNAATSGENLGKILVGGDGLTYQSMTMPAEQAQLIQQLGWTVEDVARAFAVPLYKINAGPMPTSNNVEALNTQYYSDTLQILMEAIELCLREGMDLPANMKSEFDLDPLLRMDTAAQVDALNKSVGGGWMKPNEAREVRNLAPTEGGDAVYLQQQYYSLAALAKRDQGDPFAAPPAPEPALAAPAPAEPDEEDGEEARALADALIAKFVGASDVAA
jgi:HK97 family phage portal protein